MTKNEMLFGKPAGVDSMIDLRSDVVTKPTKQMLKSMLNAKVGNDGWREDQNVLKLEKKIAKILGKEEALLVPSGTMANEICLQLLAPRGSEVIVERNSHIFNYEAAGPAALSGIQLLPIEGKFGILTWEDIEKNIRPRFHQFLQTSCISLENTHNNGGGKIYPLNIIREISENAKSKKIKMHLDGSRLFNATTSSGIKPKEYAQHFDLVNICLSKGLGCPGGALIVGSKELIDQAILIRRRLGGSLRQISGYMAAAGIYALDNNIKRLKEDHAHAQIISESIKNSKNLVLISEPETNIVLFKHKNLSPEDVCKKFLDKKILIAPYNYPILRIVTHLGVKAEDVAHFIKVVNEKFY